VVTADTRPVFFLKSLTRKEVVNNKAQEKKKQQQQKKKKKRGYIEAKQKARKKKAYLNLGRFFQIVVQADL
jgi:hypothetical protein